MEIGIDCNYERKTGAYLSSVAYTANGGHIHTKTLKTSSLSALVDTAERLLFRGGPDITEVVIEWPVAQYRLESATRDTFAVVYASTIWLTVALQNQITVYTPDANVIRRQLGWNPNAGTADRFIITRLAELGHLKLSPGDKLRTATPGLTSTHSRDAFCAAIWPRDDKYLQPPLEGEHA